MIVKLLTEHHLEFLSLKEAAEARPSLHMSICHIVGNHMLRLKCMFISVIWKGNHIGQTMLIRLHVYIEQS